MVIRSALFSKPESIPTAVIIYFSTSFREEIGIHKNSIYQLKRATALYRIGTIPTWQQKGMHYLIRITALPQKKARGGGGKEEKWEKSSSVETK